jgi:pimeloyl-ACP methyl ester carboxylesterase
VRIDVQLGQVHAYRYPPPAEPPRYNLLIAHGIGGHGATYDVFCEPLAARGVNVHSIDLPGHGLARNPSGEFRFVDWLEDIDEAARLIKEQSVRPLFVLGSSQGSAAAFHSLAFSPAVDGAVTMGIILTGVPMEHDSASKRIGQQMAGPQAAAIAKRDGDRRRIDLRTAINWDRDYAKEDSNVLQKKQADPLRTWSYGFASLHSYWNYLPPVPPGENRKPVLVTAGGDDPLMPQPYVESCFAAIGGPKELYVMPGAGHQLMLYYTGAYVDVVDGWISRQVDQLDAVKKEDARRETAP